MPREPDSITLSLDDLRVMGRWAAECAERALPVFESRAPSDPRPRAAIEGIRRFASGGKRTAQLRSLVWAAYAAARDIAHPAATAAARAAGLAAGIAYLHPLAMPHQTRHILGPPAYAALACELERSGDPSAGAGEIRWAVEHAPPEVRAVLRQIPADRFGKGRLGGFFRELDAGLRGPVPT